MSGLKLKYVPQIPNPVIGGRGVDVEKHNGNWVISLDYFDFPVIANWTPQPGQYVLTFVPTYTYTAVPLVREDGNTFLREDATEYDREVDAVTTTGNYALVPVTDLLVMMESGTNSMLSETGTPIVIET